MSRPVPPSASGIAMPIRPSSPICLTVAAGNQCSLSTLAWRKKLICRPPPASGLCNEMQLRDRVTQLTHCYRHEDVVCELACRVPQHLSPTKASSGRPGATHSAAMPYLMRFGQRDERAAATWGTLTRKSDTCLRETTHLETGVAPDHGTGHVHVYRTNVWRAPHQSQWLWRWAGSEGNLKWAGLGSPIMAC